MVMFFKYNSLCVTRGYVLKNLYTALFLVFDHVDFFYLCMSVFYRNGLLQIFYTFFVSNVFFPGI